MQHDTEMPKEKMKEAEAVQDGSILNFVGTGGTTQPLNFSYPCISNTLAHTLSLRLNKGNGVISADELRKINAIYYPKNKDKDNDKDNDKSKPIYRCVDGEGKLTDFSIMEIRLIKLLSAMINIYDPETAAAIEKANNTLTENGSFNVVMGEDAPSKTFRNVPIENLCKLLMRGRKGIEQMEATTKALNRLRNCRLAIPYKVNDKVTILRCGESLINYTNPIYVQYSELHAKGDTRGRKVTDADKLKKLKSQTFLVAADITLNSPFLHKLDVRRSPLSLKYFDIANNTKVFHILCSDLEGKYENHYVAYQKTRRNFHKREGMAALKKADEPQYNKLLKEAETEALTYECKIETLKTRLHEDYDDRRKKGRFSSYLGKAIEDLISYGIITPESYISKGEKKLYFVFNIDFQKEAAEYNKNYLQML